MAPASANSAGEAGPGRDGHDRAALAGAPPWRARGGDLLGEVRDPDPVRAAGLDAGLDRGAHVVDVHVHVPQPVAADDDERVAERGRAPSCSAGMPVVVGVEEVHHLVGRAVRR